ncbi:MAG: hypothetical protein M1482_07895 [Chloroflexi bacterium]|nr:hypothetical protein [Chloroflexota bacterium]
MRLKHWVSRVALGLVLVAGALACRTTNVFLAEATKVPTRTPRPTFTPMPTETFTPVPTNTPLPTATKVPTRRPTARPRPTNTPVPPPTAIPQPTTPQYRYKSANKGCDHSGQTFIQGTIYDTSGNHVNGVTVVMSGSSDGAIADKRESGTDGDGFYSMIVNAAGASPGQSRWVWVVDNGQRASDIVQFDFNNLPDTNPSTCWRGFVDFVQQY